MCCHDSSRPALGGAGSGTVVQKEDERYRFRDVLMGEASAECACPEGFPIERKFHEIDAISPNYVVIRGHSGDCPRVDELVRFGN